MQIADLSDLQTRAWGSQTRTSVSQTSASYRYRYIGIGIEHVYIRIGNTIYNLPVCSLQSAYVAHRFIYFL